MESWITDLIIQAVAGGVGGTAAGSILKDLSLGKPGDAISGAIGGGLVGQILSAVLGGGAAMSAAWMSPAWSRTSSAAAWAARW